MRVIVSSTDESASGWLESVLRSAGLSVVVLPTPDPGSPELAGAELLIADPHCAKALTGVGPDRRMLLIPRGQTVDVAAAVSGGFMDLIVVPAPEDDVLGRVGRALDKLLRARKPPEGDQAKIDELRVVVDRVVTALKAAGPKQRATAHTLAESLLSVFTLLVDSHETTERGTPAHSRRTGMIVKQMCEVLGLPATEHPWMEMAGRLHDIGMLALELPEDKAAPLSVELRRGLRSHPKISADILKALGPWGMPIEAIALHHERPDGSGYPKGLSGDKIPLEAQILGVADVYEALVTARPWRGAETPSGAMETLRMLGYDPEIVSALEGVVLDESRRTQPPVGG